LIRGRPAGRAIRRCDLRGEYIPTSSTIQQNQPKCPIRIKGQNTGNSPPFR
jgi:hypothetical protein